MLYNGCRSGEIFSIDVRQRNRRGQSWKGIRLFHDSAVTSIRLLEAEHYLMAADMAGKVMGLLHLGHSVPFSMLIPVPRVDACCLRCSMALGGCSMCGSSSRSTYLSTIKCSLLVSISSFSSYFNLQIKLWDLRTAKCVKHYKGHHNEYAILPLHVNEEEGLLTAGRLTSFPLYL